MKGKKTGGRKKGSKNQRTKELDKAAAKGITPLGYMLEVMRDQRAPVSRRDDMAKAAAPYLHAKRAPEDKSGQTAQVGVMGVWRVDAYLPAALRKNDETEIESPQGERPPK
jgi:hypothetical protein